MELLRLLGGLTLEEMRLDDDDVVLDDDDVVLDDDDVVLLAGLVDESGLGESEA